MKLTFAKACPACSSTLKWREQSRFRRWMVLTRPAPCPRCGRLLRWKSGPSQAGLALAVLGILLWVALDRAWFPLVLIFIHLGVLLIVLAHQLEPAGAENPSGGD